MAPRYVSSLPDEPFAGAVNAQIRAGYLKPKIKQNLRNARHARAADSGEMKMKFWIIHLAKTPVLVISAAYQICQEVKTKHRDNPGSGLLH